MDRPLVRHGQIASNGLRLDVTDQGDPRDPAVVLVHGLGQSQADWPPALLATLAAQGLRVIVFDNRDVGRSTRLPERGSPPLGRLWLAAKLGRAAALLPSARPPYRLADMAIDTLGLVDALGLGPVHLVGASMGGMIAQHIAAQCPSRVQSLTCIMSSPGARGLPGPHPAIAKAMARASTATSAAEAAAELMALRTQLASPLAAADAAELRDRIAIAARHGWPGEKGAERQFAAILADLDRHRLLARITAPTLVIHGHDDPLLPIAHGRALASAIAGARFVPIAGMGHEITASLAPRIAGLIADIVAGHRR